jgi:hypothetical protein
MMASAGSRPRQLSVLKMVSVVGKTSPRRLSDG